MRQAVKTRSRNMLPARLVALLVLALTLGTMSIGKLRTSSSAAIHSKLEAQAAFESQATGQGDEVRCRDRQAVSPAANLHSDLNRRRYPPAAAAGAATAARAGGAAGARHLLRQVHLGPTSARHLFPARLGGSQRQHPKHRGGAAGAARRHVGQVSGRSRCPQARCWSAAAACRAPSQAKATWVLAHMQPPQQGSPPLPAMRTAHVPSRPSPLPSALRRYHPGMDEIVLQPNASTGRVHMEIIQACACWGGWPRVCRRAVRVGGQAGWLHPASSAARVATAALLGAGPGCSSLRG